MRRDGKEAITTKSNDIDCNPMWRLKKIWAFSMTNLKREIKS